MDSVVVGGGVSVINENETLFIQYSYNNYYYYYEIHN